MDRRATFLAAFVVLLLCAATLSGCATARAGWVGDWWVQTVQMTGPAGGYEMEVRYRAGAAGGGWEEGPAAPGDFSFYNKRLGASIYADSSCGKKYRDAALVVLSNHLTMGFDDVEMGAETELQLSDRAGLERLSTGRLDGVGVALATSVVKKGPCVFDMVLVASPDGFEQALTDYRRFRDGFDAEVRR